MPIRFSASLLNALTLFVLSIALLGCTGSKQANVQSHSNYPVDDFKAVNTKSGRIIDKNELPSSDAWVSEVDSSGRPPGWTSGNFLMDGVITYLHSSMFATEHRHRTGSTYAYLIEVSNDEKIRVLSKYSGFSIGECVNVLFGQTDVRIVYNDQCR